MANDIYDRRRRNLAALLQEVGAKTALAVKLDMTAAQISHWLRAPDKAGARQIKEDSARQIERAIGLQLGALDRDPDRSVESASPRNGRPVDADLLAATTRAVLLEVQAIKGKPMIEKIANVVQLAYEHNSAHGSLDERYIHDLVKLMQ